jgi:hypothetical protein
MAANIPVEEEWGTGLTRVHPHNGYYAGDFPSTPTTVRRFRRAQSPRRPAGSHETAMAGRDPHNTHPQAS